MLSLADLLPSASAHFGDRPALITRDRRLSFAELDQLSDRAAAALRDRGLEPAQRVALYGQNCWQWLVAYHAVLKAGLVVVPLNVMLTASEVAHAVGDSTIVAIIGASEKLAPLAEQAGELASLELLLAFDDFAELLTADAPPLPPVEIDPRGLASVGYTSGTTGHPKGAMQSHRAILLNAALTATMHGRHRGDVMVTALPAPHVYGNAAIHATLLAGGCVVLEERFDPTAVLGLVEEHEATLFEGVPTMYAQLLAHDDLDRSRLTKLTRCTVGGQTMPITTIRAWEDASAAPLLELWGMTEIAGLGTTHSVYAPNVHGSIGVSLPGVDVRVASRDDPSKTMPVGDPGELMVRGPIVMLGYLGHEEATRDAIEPDGWLHTGDVATMDDSGHFYVLDRMKDVIITAGFNIYPAEIERVLAAHPSVSMVGVGKRADAVKGELACAYVVLKRGTVPDKDDLLAHCRQQLAAYKVPRDVVFVDDLPKTSTGKIMRRELGGSELASVFADVTADESEPVSWFF